MAGDQADSNAFAPSILFQVARTVAGEVGHSFLLGLVESLRECMDANLVFITVTDGHPPTTARAIYALRDGAPIDGFNYDLDGTPCVLVMGGETVVVPCRLAEHFPKEEGFASYVGVPIRSEDGAVSGHLAIVSSKPIDCERMAQGVAQLFAQRIEAERRRVDSAREREALIADLARLNERLRRTYMTVHEANAFKTRLLGIIAHDLRNPLAAIVAQAELMSALIERDKACAQRLLKASEKVVANADRMTSMIDATLTRVREEAASLELKRDAVDLCALARVAVEANRAAAEAKSIRIDVAHAADAVAEVDEELALEAIDNLISNAVKYSYESGVVLVSVVADDASVEIAVADHGQGLTDGDLRRVFRRFETLSAKPTGGETATGLGLANVKEIVEAHGGVVSVLSAGRDLGATFRIRLPRRAGAALDASEPAPSDAAEPPEAAA